MCQGQVFATPPVIHYTLRFCLRFRGKAIVRQDWRRSSCGEKKKGQKQGGSCWLGPYIWISQRRVGAKLVQPPFSGM